MRTLCDSAEPQPPARSGTQTLPAHISVVLPILNGEAHLEEQLAALAAQTYAGPWELVAVDNGCTDRSMAIVESWRDRVPELLGILGEQLLRQGRLDDPRLLRKLAL